MDMPALTGSVRLHPGSAGPAIRASLKPRFSANASCGPGFFASG